MILCTFSWYPAFLWSVFCLYISAVIFGRNEKKNFLVVKNALVYQKPYFVWFANRKTAVMKRKYSSVITWQPHLSIKRVVSYQIPPSALWKCTMMERIQIAGVKPPEHLFFLLGIQLTDKILYHFPIVYSQILWSSRVSGIREHLIFFSFYKHVDRRKKSTVTFK